MTLSFSDVPRALFDAVPAANSLWLAPGKWRGEEWCRQPVLEPGMRVCISFYTRQPPVEAA